ncbi:hypothetical protein MK489_24580, partial [Myxococcota bacterium]|nr:hypothetical protein [Myxococcota bacterium]
LLAGSMARLWGREEGWVAGALLLVVPIHVLDSHYARPEILTVFWITGALVCALETVRSRASFGVRGLFLGGLCAGLATSSMLSGAIAFGALTGAVIETAQGKGSARGGQILRALCLLGSAGAIGWLMGNFEALLHPSAFLDGLAVARSTHQGGHVAFPLRQLTGVAAYAMGAPVVLAGYLGVAMLCWQGLPGRFVLLGTVALGGILLGRVGGDMMRHLEPLVPALIAGAAVALVAASRGLARRGLPQPLAWVLVPGVVWLMTLQLSLGYVWPLHADEDPRYHGGRWLLENAAPGSTVGRTASYFEDWTFEPRLPAGHPFRIAPLMLRAGFDASEYLDTGFDYVVTSDYARSHAATPSAQAFHRRLEESGEYRLGARFEPDGGPWSIPRALGILRPSDLFYVTTGFDVYERALDEPSGRKGD